MVVVDNEGYSPITELLQSKDTQPVWKVVIPPKQSKDEKKHTSTLIGLKQSICQSTQPVSLRQYVYVFSLLVCRIHANVPGYSYINSPVPQAFIQSFETGYLLVSFTYYSPPTHLLSQQRISVSHLAFIQTKKSL